MLKRTSALAAATAIGAVAFAAAPAQAEAQAPSDIIAPIVSSIPPTPGLPAELSPDVHLPSGLIPGFSPGLVPLPNGPEDIPLVP